MIFEQQKFGGERFHASPLLRCDGSCINSSFCPEAQSFDLPNDKIPHKTHHPIRTKIFRSGASGNIPRKW